MFKGQSLEEFLNEIKEAYNSGSIKVASKQVISMVNSNRKTYMIVVDKVEPEITDIRLAQKIQTLAHNIHYGQTYPLEALDELIELGEAAKKFKEEN